MHRFVMLSLSLVLMAAGAAQAGDSTEAILKGKKLLTAAVNSADFEKIGEARELFASALATKSHGLFAHYYIALADYRLVTISQGQGKLDGKMEGLIEGAIDHLKKAVALDDQFAEGYALLSSFYGQKIGVRPELGMTLGPLSTEMLTKAKTLQPTNPRITLMDSI